LRSHVDLRLSTNLEGLSGTEDGVSQFLLEAIFCIPLQFSMKLNYNKNDISVSEYFK